MTGAGAIVVPPLPVAFAWAGAAGEHRIAGSSLVLEASGGTDWFVDPTSGTSTRSAPALVGAFPDGDFILSARVVVEARSRFDAGCLMLYADDANWAKLCLEQSPEGSLMVVSVVTRGRSDDCNNERVPGDTAWLRVARLGDSYAFHASEDGRAWRFVRLFALQQGPARVGFEAQSPTGAGCTASFDSIRLDQRRLGDLRDGS